MIRSFVIATDAEAFENVADAATEHLVSGGILAVSEFDVIDTERVGESEWSVTVDIDTTEPALAFCRACDRRIVNLGAGVLVRGGLPMYHATCFASLVYRTASTERTLLGKLIRSTFPRFTAYEFVGDTEAEVRFRSDVPGEHHAHVRLIDGALHVEWSTEDTDRTAWEAGE